MGDLGSGGARYAFSTSTNGPARNSPSAMRSGTCASPKPATAAVFLTDGRKVAAVGVLAPR